MRWTEEQVTFEPGGKDHGTEGSSYTVGKIIVDKVFGYTAPDFVMYEFIGIKGGGGKMSSSSGVSFTPEELLKVCPPEMILWLYSKVPARQSWNFCFDDEILRQYHEFDRSLSAYYSDNCPNNIKEVMRYVTYGRKVTPSTVSAQLLFSLGSIVNFEQETLFELYKRIDENVKKEDLLNRLDRIKYWATTYSPESIAKLLPEKDTQYYSALPTREQQDIKQLYTKLSTTNYTKEELQQLLYDIPKQDGLTDKENQPYQKKFFQNVYKLLIGKDNGPRLYLFLGALKKEMYLNLLNF